MDYIKEEPSTITDSHNVPLGDLLVHTSIPAAAVTVKLCAEDSMEEIGETVSQKKEDILSTFKRRTFNRISFKGESNPLLNRLSTVFC
ncbi:hypothetical protein PUN28_003773 [Cardiocondyla obscurior]|uniref:Uncharacterized protein n=1 Tax=Cardiocondyla obscurior TaxID=286306 RepID=A0AAW2GK67_9HYME